MAAGRIAMQDLEDEQMDGGNWIEHAFAPRVTEDVAEILNGAGGQPVSQIRLDPPDGSDNTMSHPWPPCGMGFVITHILRGGLVFLLYQWPNTIGAATSIEFPKA